MSGILDLLNSPVGQQIISGVSSQTGQSTDKTGSLLSMAMPVLMGAMQKNASTPEGASGLLSAISGKHAGGGILDNLGGLFEGGVEDNVTNDGAGILGHILGGKQPAVENALSQKSGMDAGSVAQILKVAAPILMGVLGKQASQNNVSDANGLTNMLGGMLGGGQGSKQQSLIESFLDADGDGSILDDVAGMVLGGGNSQKKGGLGGLLGGLFGK
ncbi:DUF937 domain-containing protein [Aquimarina sp. BL5]|uniref:DUF937 domain-containing protein n=1 Tax=Aquimarina sp. BL5 TaxID=1714860 RepID=UPI000E4A5265|nr:DUF937 domain-containing protein [Aquimarina sp. BL5]AXT49965.1 DUF937 domain-containing protein [Aquimarina sp. BL5]RKN07448.1 DUF937 domain-containing protein [Aquimarina sp. BL5]